MDNEKLKRELDIKKQLSRLLQKKILTCLMATVLICFLGYVIILTAESGWFTGEETIEPQGYLFYPDVDYEYNIMNDEGYKSILHQQPLISLSNAATGETTTLDPIDYNNNGDAVTLLTGLVLAIQQGDTDSYNSCFSDLYHISVGKKKAANADDPSVYDGYTDEQYLELGREDGFTMQQIYNVVITRVSEEVNEDTDIATYNYRLKYMIRRNNGTLRLDMDSDSYREQTVVITGNSSETPKIVSVITNMSDNVRTVVHGWRVATVSVAALAIAAGIVILTVYILKRLNKKREGISVHEETACR